MPGAESPARYGKRLRRIAEALALYGEEVEEATVEQRIIRALYLDKIHGKEGPQQLAMLKEFFQELVLLEPPEDQEQEHEMRVNILLGMIQDKGGQLSKSAQKLFSSEENTPEKPRVKKTTVEQTATGRKSLIERNPADEGRGKDRSREPRRNTSKETLELDHLRKRVKELEGDARSEGSHAFDASAFAEALEKQTKVMTEALTRKNKRSTIQVTPKISWPMLDDECSDYRSVQEFYDTFEATIGLANDGDGMTDIERLTTLKACLKQHRLKTYELGCTAVTLPLGWFKRTLARFMTRSKESIFCFLKQLKKSRFGCWKKETLLRRGSCRPSNGKCAGNPIWLTGTASA